MMNSSSSSGGGSPIIMSQHEKPKDIFGAISEIEIYSSAEEQGAVMPERFATLKDRMDYFNLGMRSIFGGAFISLLLAPVSTAVIGNQLPIFGNFNPTFIEKVLAYILSFGYTLAYMMLFVYVARIKGGVVSKIISANLLIGMSVGAVLKCLAATFIYGLIYFIVLTPENLYQLLSWLLKLGIPKHAYEFVHFMLSTLKSSLIPAIYLFFYTTVALILIPWLVVIIKKIKNRKEEF